MTGKVAYEKDKVSTATKYLHIPQNNAERRKFSPTFPPDIYSGNFLARICHPEISYFRLWYDISPRQFFPNLASCLNSIDTNPLCTEP